MKEQFAELSIGALKVAPPASVAVATGVGALNPQSLLVWLSVVYSVGLLIQLLVNNWAKWSGGIVRAVRWVARKVRR